MKNAAGYRVVLVTVPDFSTARLITGKILRARLAACVNLLPRLESHYWWHGKLEQAQEVLLLIKTRQPWLARLEKLILSAHPYTTPEIIALSLQSGQKNYLAWMDAALAPRAEKTAVKARTAPRGKSGA